MLHGLRVDGSMREENHTVVVTSQTLYDTHRINQLAKRAPHMGTGDISTVQGSARRTITWYEKTISVVVQPLHVISRHYLLEPTRG